MFKHFVILILILASALLASAQSDDSYKIEIKIKGSQDSILYLANYYGDKTYIADTAYNIKGKGTFVFEKNEELGGGLYIIVSQARRSLFEFLVADSRDMKFETKAPDYVEEMKIHNSDENELFFAYLGFSSDLYKRVKPINTRLKELDAEDDSIAIYREEIKTINSEMTDYKEAVMKDHPESFLASFFGLIKDASIPDTMPSLADGSKDSLYPYRYYKAHYWDAVDLSDDRLIRTPVFYKKLDTYFDQVVSKDADTIISEIDKILAKMDESGELYKYSLWRLTVKYDESQIMGHDAILVHMSDTYFSKGKAPWLDKAVVKNIMDEADKRRGTIIGQQAPNLIMQDTNLKPRSLYDIPNEYIVMFFWDPKCGHCKEEIPHLVNFYENYAEKLNVEVFAVCADSNMKEMKKAIRTRKMSFVNVNGPRSYTTDYHDLYNIFSTPVLIVLNKERKIIAKRLLSEQLPEFLENYSKYGKKE